ncbi:MAG: glutamine amidotransferase, partial [Alphaproteobacteria bacterium]
LHLGGQVRAHTQGCVEHGYYPIRPTQQGAEVLNWPDHVYQWHREGFTVPETSVLLAESDFFPHQAFRHGAAFALQFHPEITQLVMNRWVTRSGYRLVMPGARPGPAHRSEHLQYGQRQRHWLGEFLAKWVRVAIH